MQDKTILVTGGTGFIGGALTRALLEARNDVRVLYRSEGASARRLESEGAELVRGDMRDAC